MAAGVAIHQAVRADANVELRLTEAAELVADALVFRHLALAATVLGVAGSGGHSNNCSAGGNMPLVTPLHKWMGVEVRVRVLCWHEGDLTFETLFQTRASILVDWLYGRDRSFFSLTYFQRG